MKFAQLILQFRTVGSEPSQTTNCCPFLGPSVSGGGLGVWSIEPHPSSLQRTVPASTDCGSQEVSVWLKCSSAGAPSTHQLYHHLQTPCKGTHVREERRPCHWPCRYTSQAAGFLPAPWGVGPPCSSRPSSQVPRLAPPLCPEQSPGVLASPPRSYTSLSAPTPALHLNILPEERMLTSPTQ